MTIKQYIQTSVEIWGIIFCIIAIIIVFFTRRFDKKASHSLILILLSCVALMGFDLPRYLITGAGNNAAHIVSRILYFGSYTMAFLIIPLVAEYASHIIYARTNGIRIYWSLMEWIVFFIGVTALIVNEFIPYIYRIDTDGTYIALNWFFALPYVLVIVGLMMTFTVMIVYFKYLHTVEKVSMFIYLTLPIIALMLRLIVREISFINIAVVISVITMFIAYEAEYSKYMIEKERQLNDEKLRIINRQMQPHFIFNSLSLIRYLCQHSQKEAVEVINDFSACLRRTTDFLGENDCITASKELDLVRHYLSIQNKRFDESIKIDFDIRDEEFDVPPFSIQTLVENALHHGLNDGQVNDAALTVRTEKRGDEHIVEVIDNGVGFDPGAEVEENDEDRDHIGMANTIKRLEVMCNGRLEIESEPGNGTCVRMIIPD